MWQWWDSVGSTELIPNLFVELGEPVVKITLIMWKSKIYLVHSL